jgi:hypothetical protein
MNINDVYMKLFAVGLVITGTFLNAVYSQVSATISVDISSPGHLIPNDFIGLSFETRRVDCNSDGVSGYFFDSTNTQAVALFRQIGVKSLRVGGGSVDDSKTPIPTTNDIDALFRFARVADVKVIYSLPLRNGNAAQNAAIAKYIRDNYHDHLDCFTIGNEPQNYAAFSQQWKPMADVIVKAVPEAKFCGPAPMSSMDGGAEQIRNFARDFRKTGMIKMVTAHDYPGGNARRNATDGNSGRDQMLSAAWDDHYQAFYDEFVPFVSAMGLKYKYDEASSFYAGGAKDASDTFAAALWCLDFMHWWAAHGCAGINFHNNRWSMYNITICKDATGHYQSRPQGYGIKAFDAGGHGRVVAVTISRTGMTAYGVTDSTNLYLTIINKEHGQYGRDAEVKVKGMDINGSVSIMYLKAPNNDVSATTGIMLGGATLNNTGEWQGKWTTLQPSGNGPLTIPVSAASAAIVKIPLPPDKDGRTSKHTHEQPQPP